MTYDVLQTIHTAINVAGKITFAYFMELALYWPHGGYYSHLRTESVRDDFYTAPTAHPIFGALITVQLEQMWRILDCPSPFLIVEMGAGDGRLAKDVLAFAAFQFPAFHNAIDYVLLERGRTVGITGAQPYSKSVQLLKSKTVPFRGVVGCFLSNELLDSFPVHRVLMDDGKLREIYVGLENGKLIEILDEPSTTHLAQRLDELNIKLPNGFRTEICLDLDSWVTDVSSALDKGYVITIDYGHIATILYSRQRAEGTLRLYYKHMVAADPYTLVGRQDITSHVDFTTLIRAGHTNGLVNPSLVSQREALFNLGLDYFIRALDLKGLNLGALNANRMGMLDLVRLGGMGDFGVLIQGKGVPTYPLYALTKENSWLEDVAQRYKEMEIPLLTFDHMPLMAGRYPHYLLEWDGHRSSGVSDNMPING